jgi:hypothetical protein
MPSWQSRPRSGDIEMEATYNDRNHNKQWKSSTDLRRGAIFLVLVLSFKPDVTLGSGVNQNMHELINVYYHQRRSSLVGSTHLNHQEHSRWQKAGMLDSKVRPSLNYCIYGCKQEHDQWPYATHVVGRQRRPSTRNHVETTRSPSDSYWQDLHSLAFIQMHCVSFC